MRNSDGSASIAPNESFSAAWSLLFLLVLVDAVFIAVHVAHVWSPWLKQAFYSLENDGGMAEQYQYIKHVWVAASFGVLFLRQRSVTLAGWSLFFAFLFVDDAAQVHENIGTVVSNAFGFQPMFGLRAKDFGEILVAAAIGGAAVVFASLSIWRGRDTSRRVSADLVCFLIALGLFGVFFDTLHTITHFRLPIVAPVFALVEDGGEMIVASLIVVYAFDVMSNAGRVRVPVWEWIRARATRGASPPCRT
jgi:hypothetical protein